MKNEDLKEIYNEQKLNWYSGYEESMTLAALGSPWKDKKVLEIGCGQGHLASILAYAGADVLGIDYAKDEIDKASAQYYKDGLNFEHMKDFHDLQNRYDCIVMQGVLEHFDEPTKELKWIADSLLRLGSSASILISVPHWWNPRGFILQALRILCNAKISLTDIHYFLPEDIKQMAFDAELVIREFQLCDESRGQGEDAITDMMERIPKAMPNISKDKMKEFRGYFKKALMSPTIQRFNGLGATAAYKMTR